MAVSPDLKSVEDTTSRNSFKLQEEEEEPFYVRKPGSFFYSSTIPPSTKSVEDMTSRNSFKLEEEENGPGSFFYNHLRYHYLQHSERTLNVVRRPRAWIWDALLNNSSCDPLPSQSDHRSGLIHFYRFFIEHDLWSRYLISKIILLLMKLLVGR